jgi:undecaprenyl-diphosphatase
MTGSVPSPLRPVRHPVALVVLGLCGIVLTGALGFTVTHWAQWTAWETGALSGIALTHAPAGLALASFIAWLFSPTIAALLTLAAAIAVAVLTRSPTRGVVFAVTVAVCWGASETMKFAVQRPRPQLAHAVVATPTSFSFPSGHVAFTCALVLAVLFTLRDSRRLWVLTAIGAGLVLVVAWSRMYLGVHFPTDVTASVVLVPSVYGVVIPLIVNVALPLLRGTAGVRAEGAVHGGHG